MVPSSTEIQNCHWKNMNSGRSIPETRKLLLNLDFQAVVLLCQWVIYRHSTHEARLSHLPPGTDWLPVSFFLGGENAEPYMYQKNHKDGYGIFRFNNVKPLLLYLQPYEIVLHWPRPQKSGSSEGY